MLEEGEGGACEDEDEGAESVGSFGASEAEALGQPSSLSRLGSSLGSAAASRLTQ